MKDDSVLYQIKSLESMIVRNFFAKSIKDNFSFLSQSQIMILDYIINSENKLVYQNTLEKVFGLSRATISEVLGTMEKNGLIIRNVSKKDTRIKVITLSEKANSLFDKNKDKIKSLEKIVTKDITSDELKMFYNIINRMKNNVINYKV